MLKKRAQSTKPKLEQPQRAPPAHMQSPPEPMQLPLDECMQNTTWNRAAATTQPWSVWPVNTTGQTGEQYVNRASTLTGQPGDLVRSDRCTPEPRNGSKPRGNLLNASSKPFQAQTSPLVGNAWIKPKMQNFQPRASQIDKIQHRMLHMSKWAS
jgi:hypothetical protein